MMNCSEKALAAQLTAQFGVPVKHVRITTRAGRIRVRVSFAGPVEALANVGTVSRGVLRIDLDDAEAPT